jgi:hypothetical protein
MAEFVWWKDGLPPLLGVAGFALSVFNFWKASKKDKRQVALAAFWSSEPFNSPNSGTDYLVIKATNIGSRSLVVDRLILSFEGKLISQQPLDSETATILDESSSLPKELKEGHSVYVYLQSNWFPQAIKVQTETVLLDAKCTLSTQESFEIKDIKFNLKTKQFPDLVFI